jgi:hypothetical protein
VSARLSLVIAIALTVAACAPIPRPSLLADVDRVRTGPVAAEASRYAPDAYARAQKLRDEAEAAFVAGDTAGAQLIAERALAAYARAGAIARTARAEATTTDAKVALSAAEAEVTALDADQARVGAEADALERRLKVARDAQPIQASGRADAERERARLAAARALAMEARLLCGAARLLGSFTSGTSGTSGAPPADAKPLAPLDEAEAALAKVETELSAASVPAAPIDGATRARAACLAALTGLRRAASPVSRAPGAGDALLAEVSAMGTYAPARDDRGVAVALRGVFSGAHALSPQGEARLAELGKIAAAHPTFPIEVVIHTDRPLAPRDEPPAKAQAEAAVRALQKGGGSAVHAAPFVAGNLAPIADPAGPDRARNARLEIVFVTPEGF